MGWTAIPLFGLRFSSSSVNERQMTASRNRSIAAAQIPHRNLRDPRFRMPVLSCSLTLDKGEAKPEAMRGIQDRACDAIARVTALRPLSIGLERRRRVAPKAGNRGQRHLLTTDKFPVRVRIAAAGTTTSTRARGPRSVSEYSDSLLAPSG